jgi:hypothetical protein
LTRRRSVKGAEYESQGQARSVAPGIKTSNVPALKRAKYISALQAQGAKCIKDQRRRASPLPLALYSAPLALDRKRFRLTTV